MEELPKAFDPRSVETARYRRWESSGCFVADASSSKPSWSIVMPPPNVTGVLHMGHALVNTLQDVLVRWKRMSGFEVCWIPGTDHAGIATQTVVEKKLKAETGKRRTDLSREEFVSLVWDWKEKSEKSILEQLRKLGCSCDWSRLCFTMDAVRSKAVKQMFKKMFDAGLVYRGDYLVNWDPVTQTALADDEVEHEERDGFLWYFRYPVAGEEGFVTVATTRPETLLGDTAVAVSPSDPRYAHLHGKQITVPLTGRTVPVILDSHVDPSFGSGAVKVTPAHDPNDYEMGLTHHLPMINIVTPDGKINENGGSFAGLSTEEARIAVVAAMQKEGLVEKIVPHKHRVGLSYRSKAVIEPFLSKQWFVKMHSFKQTLRSLVEEKKVKLIPESWESTYFHWIDNLRDWCVSRQLWWGHRIPVWYAKDDPDTVICHPGDDLPEEVRKDPDRFVQEEDVLDTWFSSALWPIATLGWPEKTADFEKFYPNATLITGHDILFFWVARMLAMGTYACGTAPFPETFLHGLIYGKSYWRKDKEGGTTYILGEERREYDNGKPLPKGVESKWEKMSKSKGNIIDPIEMIDSFGADAVRTALCAGATHARQIDLDRRKFEEFKNFANKIWNGARFVFLHLSDLSPDDFAEGLSESLLTTEDRWILSLAGNTAEEVNAALAEYRFDRAALTAYNFFWKEFCAYYVEICKPFLTGKTGTADIRRNKQKILAIVLSTSLRLLHPMAPFITEELFEKLSSGLRKEPKEGADPYTKECLVALSAKGCIVAPYPKKIRTEREEEKISATFSLLEELVHAVRNIRAEMQIPPGTATDLRISGVSGDPIAEEVKAHAHILLSLVKIGSLKFSQESEQDGFGAKKRVRSLELFIPLPEELVEKERLRLAKEREKTKNRLLSLEQKLSEEEFVRKAPKEVREKLEAEISLLRKQLADNPETG